MEWFDTSSPTVQAGVLRFEEQELELHIVLSAEGTFAAWVLESGEVLREVPVAQA